MFHSISHAFRLFPYLSTRVFLSLLSLCYSSFSTSSSLCPSLLLTLSVSDTPSLLSPLLAPLCAHPYLPVVPTSVKHQDNECMCGSSSHTCGLYSPNEGFIIPNGNVKPVPSILTQTSWLCSSVTVDSSPRSKVKMVITQKLFHQSRLPDQQPPQLNPWFSWLGGRCQPTWIYFIVFFITAPRTC